MQIQVLYLSCSETPGVYCVNIHLKGALTSCLCLLGSLKLPSHPGTPSRLSESRSATVAPAYHTLPHSSHGPPHSNPMWGPLEPPKTPKPWSLSCLRPAPPLRPSAALSYKEVLECFADWAGPVGLSACGGRGLWWAGHLVLVWVGQCGEVQSWAHSKSNACLM